MTLIQYISGAAVGNVACSLYLRPEKLILLGLDEPQEKQTRNLKDMLERRGGKTRIHTHRVQRDSFAVLAALLKETVCREEDCAVDLTDADETLVLAVGAVLAGLDETGRKGLQLVKYDYKRNVVCSCLKEDHVLPGQPVMLTVEELILLHGGKLHPENEALPVGGDLRELDGLWSVVSGAPREWNRSIAVMREFESRSDSQTQVYLPLKQIRGGIENYKEKEAALRHFLEKLHRGGVISDSSGDNALRYTYNTQLLRYCTQKAGNVLEMKTLLEGMALRENGQPFFQDCRMGVSIDWDGEIYPPAQRVPETRNEVDVILMHGIRPLFISCKNGSIGEEELYKLHTVATRFGGPEARKMLIATELPMKQENSRRAFAQRAWDMDIFLVTDAADLSREEWEQVLKQAAQ